MNLQYDAFVSRWYDAFVRNRGDKTKIREELQQSMQADAVLKSFVAQRKTEVKEIVKRRPNACVITMAEEKLLDGIDG